MIGRSKELEDVGRVASSFPTYLGKIEATLLTGYLTTWNKGFWKLLLRIYISLLKRPEARTWKHMSMPQLRGRPHPSILLSPKWKRVKANPLGTQGIDSITHWINLYPQGIKQSFFLILKLTLFSKIKLVVLSIYYQCYQLLVLSMLRSDFVRTSSQQQTRADLGTVQLSPVKRHRGEHSSEIRFFVDNSHVKRVGSFLRHCYVTFRFWYYLL